MSNARNPDNLDILIRSAMRRGRRMAQYAEDEFDIPTDTEDAQQEAVLALLEALRHRKAVGGTQGWETRGRLPGLRAAVDKHMLGRRGLRRCQNEFAELTPGQHEALYGFAPGDET